MTIRLILLFYFLHTSIVAMSQNEGYFGKKNIVSINGLATSPIIYNFLNSSNLLKESNGKFKEGKDYFNGGVNLALTHYSSSRFGFGIEFGLIQSTCKGPNLGFIEQEYEWGGGTVTNDVYIRHEMLKLSTFTIMPRIEFSTFGSLRLFGIQNQLGIGYTNTSIVNDNYLSEANTYDVQAVLNKSLILDTDLRTHGITILYGLSARVPINKHFLFTYGIRYTLNLSFGTNDSADFLDLFDDNNVKSNYYVSDRDLRELVGSSRFMSLITAHAGFSFAF